MRGANFKQRAKGIGLTLLLKSGLPQRSVTKRVGVTPLLFHTFFPKEEARSKSVDRLRRQLDWLKTFFVPISLSDFVSGFQTGSWPDRAVLITSDDASTEVLDVIGEFNSFGVPLSAFVCAGWTSTASGSSEGLALVARCVSAIEWYQGESIRLNFGAQTYDLTSAAKATLIDKLIDETTVLGPYMEDMCSQLERPGPRSCTWDELAYLADAGVSIGAHSVSHINLATASPKRLRFELNTSKALCERFGGCDTFAYPYGHPGVYNNATKQEMQRANFKFAFIVNPTHISPQDDPFELPRISIPLEPISLDEFKARALGGTGFLRRFSFAGYAGSSGARRT